MNLLARHPLFHGAYFRDIADLLLLIRPRTVHRGTLLAGPGLAHPALILVLRGVLSSYDLTDDGRQVLYDFVDAGDLDCVMGLLGMRPHFTEAAAASVVALLDTSLIGRLNSRSQSVASNLLQAVAKKLGRRERLLQTRSVKDPSRRIAIHLLDLAALPSSRDSDRQCLRARVTNQQIADMIGLRRETVSIHFQRLLRLGLITTQGGQITLSTSRLQQFAHAPIS